MKKRELYIKPSVLRLDYTVDADVVSFSGCKTTGNTDTKTLDTGFVSGSCSETQCQSVTLS